MKKIIAGLTILLIAFGNLVAQEKDAATTQLILGSKNFIFKAQTASPQRGQLRNLTSDYDLTIKNDSAIAWLPFFGRSYNANYGSEGGIKFNSSNFAYSIEKAKKKKWDITIKPNDVPDIQTLYLTVYENSQANLQVISTNRESISFNGYIVEGKGSPKKGF